MLGNLEKTIAHRLFTAICVFYNFGVTFGPQHWSAAPHLTVPEPRGWRTFPGESWSSAIAWFPAVLDRKCVSIFHVIQAFFPRVEQSGNNHVPAGSPRPTLPEPRLALVTASPSSAG